MFKVILFALTILAGLDVEKVIKDSLAEGAKVVILIPPSHENTKQTDGCLCRSKSRYDLLGFELGSSNGSDELYEEEYNKKKDNDLSNLNRQTIFSGDVITEDSIANSLINEDASNKKYYSGQDGHNEKKSRMLDKNNNQNSITTEKNTRMIGKKDNKIINNNEHKKKQYFFGEDFDVEKEIKKLDINEGDSKRIPLIFYIDSDSDKEGDDDVFLTNSERDEVLSSFV